MTEEERPEELSENKMIATSIVKRTYAPRDSAGLVPGTKMSNRVAFSKAMREKKQKEEAAKPKARRQRDIDADYLMRLRNGNSISRGNS